MSGSSLPTPRIARWRIILVDGAVVEEFQFNWSAARATGHSATLPISRGEHEVAFAVQPDSVPARLIAIDIIQRTEEPSQAKTSDALPSVRTRARGKVIAPRGTAFRLLKSFVARAFRRPVTDRESSDSSGRSTSPWSVATHSRRRSRSHLPLCSCRQTSCSASSPLPEVPGPVPLFQPRAGYSTVLFPLGHDAGLGAQDIKRTPICWEEKRVLADQVDRLLNHPAFAVLRPNLHGPVARNQGCGREGRAHAQRNPALLHARDSSGHAGGACSPVSEDAQRESEPLGIHQRGLHVLD